MDVALVALDSFMNRLRQSALKIQNKVKFEKGYAAENKALGLLKDRINLDDLTDDEKAKMEEIEKLLDNEEEQS